MSLKKEAIDLKFSKQDIYRHVLSWSFIIIILHFLSPLGGGVISEIVGNIFIFSNYIVVYYFLSLYALNNYRLKKYLKLVLFVLLAFTFYCTYYFVFGKYILPFFGSRSDLVDQPLNLYFRDCTIFFLFVTISAVAFNINRNSKHNIEEQNKKEKLLVLRELDYLKSQFDHHLTFNFFNFLYSQVYKYSEDIADSIELFCELLRYFLKINPQKKTELQKEIKCLEQYVELKKHMVIVDNINFTVSGEVNNKYIVPGLIIILIEDIIYYNNLNSITNSISLDLTVMETSLRFTLSIKTIAQINPIILPRGNNVGQILNLFYKNNHELKYTCLNNIHWGILTLYDIDQITNNLLS